VITAAALARDPNLARSPDFAVHKVDSVDEAPDLPAGSRRGVHFDLHLKPDDALGFHSFTKSNINNQILVKVGDIPVSAPIISSEIDSGKLRIYCETVDLANQVRNHLSKLVK